MLAIQNAKGSHPSCTGGFVNCRSAVSIKSGECDVDCYWCTKLHKVTYGVIVGMYVAMGVCPANLNLVACMAMLYKPYVYDRIEARVCIKHTAH